MFYKKKYFYLNKIFYLFVFFFNSRTISYNNFLKVHTIFFIDISLKKIIFIKKDYIKVLFKKKIFLFKIYIYIFF